MYETHIHTVRPTPGHRPHDLCRRRDRVSLMRDSHRPLCPPDSATHREKLSLHSLRFQELRCQGTIHTCLETFHKGSGIGV